MRVSVLFIMILVTSSVYANCKSYHKIFKKCLSIIDDKGACIECNKLIFENNDINCEYSCVGDKDIKKSNFNNKQKIISYVKKIVKKYGIDYRIIIAIVIVESNFNKNALSSAGAVGLMQLMPSSFPHLSFKDLRNEVINLETGIKYFSWLLKLHNYDYNDALISYNMGPNAYKYYKEIGEYPKVGINYLKKVNLALMSEFNITITYFK
jgi:soluble lytic murein transglycosylase-like protein